jgi:hypothetical protein
LETDEFVSMKMDEEFFCFLIAVAFFYFWEVTRLDHAKSRLVPRPSYRNSLQ